MVFILGHFHFSIPYLRAIAKLKKTIRILNINFLTPTPALPLKGEGCPQGGMG
jgi:hypothetical protein